MGAVTNRAGRIGKVAPKGGFVRAVAALWSAQGVSLIAALVQGIVVARVLGPARFGVVTLVVAYPGLVYSFLDFRSSDASVRYISGYLGTGRADRALATARLTTGVDLIAGILALLVVAATAPWASGHVVHVDGAASWMLLISVGYLIRSFASTGQSLLMAAERFPLVARLQIGVNVARAALVAGSVLAGFGVHGAVIGTAIALGIDGLASFAIAARESRRALGGTILTVRTGVLAEDRRGLLRFLIWTNYASFVGLFAKQFDTFILGWFTGPATVGVYSFARSMISAGGSIVGGLQSVVFPRFSRLFAARDLYGLRRQVRRSAILVALPLGIGALLCLPLVPFAVRALGGQPYVSAVYPAQIMLVGTSLWLALFWLRPLIFALGEIRLYAASSTVGSLLAVAGYVVLTPRWGASGTAFAAAVASSAAMAAVLVVLARRRGTESGLGASHRRDLLAITLAEVRDGASS
jgi:O-antigen/teichoic acid export membrane protein